MQASAATAAAAAEAVAMESSDSDSSTEDDDAQPNNGRARLRKTSLSHVLLVASICGAFSCGRQANVHRERMIWGSFLGGLTRPEFSRMLTLNPYGPRDVRVCSRTSFSSVTARLFAV